ncbi:MAG: hypothetical protein K2H59_09150 [Muribaculaceae bacterium]|nr:hypothetical protein [Muribaculaceae bacterium]
MKIVIKCASAIAANRLKNQIVEDVKNEELMTWSYKRSGNNNDIIFHNPSQYVNDDTKNVIFVVTTDDNSVVLETSYWKGKPEPSREIKALHTGRLVEAILGQEYSENFRIID